VIDRVTSVDPANGDPVQTSYAVDAGSWVITTTSPTGEVASRRNDAMGRTWRTCGADGTCIDQLYTNGLLTSRARRDAAGTIFATQYLTYYPSSSRIAGEWDWLGAGEVAACGGAVPAGCAIPHLERTWTVGGRPSTVVDAQGNVTTNSYATDGSALLSKVTQTGMPDIAIAYDASYPLVTRRTFHPATGTDVTETTTYERNLRVDRIDRALNLLHEVTTFAYDGAGRVTLNQLARGTETIALTDAYDARGELATRTYAIATVAASYNGTLGYARRNNGQLASVTYPSGRIVNYNYDATTARLTSIASGADLVFEAVAPDASGRAATLRYDNNTLRVVRRFDTAGRPAGRDVYGTTANKRTETYGYDTAGRLSRISSAADVNMPWKPRGSSRTPSTLIGSPNAVVST
jgi:YD repeat-containing protein